MVCVPQNLCAPIPPDVSDDAAAFGVLGAIALQGIRLINPALGECVLVSGLGLIGLIAVQLLRANGVRVIGADFNAARLELAREFGADTVQLGEEDLESRCAAFSRGRGMDAVLITAATKSDEPVHQAALVCRKRGRIVLTGVAGLQLSRDDFYKKELSFQVSCSYGPGRYDPQYEEQGQDYPAAYVRWTEQRNFEAVLDQLAARQLCVSPLVSHRFPLEQAATAYELISGRQPSLGVLLEYPEETDRDLRETTIHFPAPSPPPRPPQRPVVGFIGAGSFATRHLLPAFRATEARLKWVATRSGVSAVSAARRFRIEHATSDAEQVLSDPEVNAVVIATRHDSHSRFVCRALAAGKHVFVEKPLALDRSQLLEIHRERTAAHRRGEQPVLLVGFNRRFAPHVCRIARLLQSVSEPKAFVMTVNAGELPADHWTQHPQLGGGRIIGEGCHFVDLLLHLAGQPVVQVQALPLGRRKSADALTCLLQFADGSTGAIHYFSNGHRAFPKERLDVFAAGRVLQLDNFCRLAGCGWPGFRREGSWRQDKGHRAEVAAFVDALRTGAPSPIAWDELVESTCVTLDIVTAAQTGQTIRYTPDRDGLQAYLNESNEPAPQPTWARSA